MTLLWIYAKLKSMRHLFICMLLVFPLCSSYGKDYDEFSDLQADEAPSGSVTTRTGGTVTTRGSKSVDRQETKKDIPRRQPLPRKAAFKAFEKKSDSFSSNDMLQEQAQSYHSQGYDLQTNGDIKGALIYYQKALELDPSNTQVINDVGVAYEGIGDAGNALRMYKKAIEMNPRYLAAYSNLAALYESKGDIKNATYYWAKRYELGQDGDRWREIAKQHLLKLGTYPEIQKEIEEKDAARLSRELRYERQEKRKNSNKDARLHMYIGARLFMNKDYTGALKEFDTGLSLEPSDEELRSKLMDFYKKAEAAAAKDKALTDAQGAIGSLRDEDFLSAEGKLRSALSTVYRVAQEK
ncbi:MAG: tetratricopeptide repeat protein [Candidatus Omnitrophota bacterium]